MKKKTFLVFILFLIWLNYLLSYEYVKIMMDTSDASKVSNTIVLLVFPIMWNYGAAIIKIISSIRKRLCRTSLTDNIRLM